MARNPKTSFSCANCGNRSPKWLGRCPACGSWNSFREEAPPTPAAASGWPALGGDNAPEARPLSTVSGIGVATATTGIAEFDRVLGGGIVPGAVILIGGDPGIGKSTLLLQAAANISRRERPVLYVTGEESPAQVKLRAARLDIEGEHIHLLTATAVPDIVAPIDTLRPAAMIIDSIQTMHAPGNASPPGSLNQIRLVTAHLTREAKTRDLPIFLIGHVTKDGAIAGPRVLEHMVDTVLYFETGTQDPFRLLRAVKNRYGATSEVGVFAMTGSGLQEVNNPSQIFITERPDSLPGSLATATMEGSRPIMIEIQGLVSASVSAGIPRRTILGIDKARAALMIAVMEKRLRLPLADKDVFLNVIGGLKVAEPAIDLAMVAALISSHGERPIPAATVVIGEVGLAGELRRIPQLAVRLREAAKFGFRRAIIPKKNLDPDEECNMNVAEITTIAELPDALYR
ncbi:MAG: DNA repair protein RadA [Deltaproteobacteria bacterium]|nr:DNA repair protein RadA [Candidatus Anaeroferrophillacea bacterium]